MDTHGARCDNDETITSRATGRAPTTLYSANDSTFCARKETPVLRSLTAMLLFLFLVVMMRAAGAHPHNVILS